MQETAHSIKAVHIIYSGLGGHGSVFFSLLEANQDASVQHIPLFYGVEPLLADYQAKCEAAHLPYAYVSKEQGIDLAAWKQLRKELANFQPDVVVAHGAYAVIPAWQYARKNKCKVVVVEHDPIPKKNTLSWIWTGLALRLADTVVALSPPFKKGMKQKLGIFHKEKKVDVIPNGIDTELYAPAPEAKAQESLLIGMHSRITPQKDHKSLLYALKELKDSPSYNSIQVRIAGDGDLMADLQQLSAELGLTDKVQWLGMLNEKEIIALLRQINIYVHPTHSETMSTSLMQAMAAGLPMITTDVPGVTHMVAHRQTGLCTAHSDAHELASAMKELIENRDLRIALGEKARQYAESHFSHVNMCQNYTRLFRKLLS
jgi:glycosyltransferase involved in cell wall biosynthesis